MANNLINDNSPIYNIQNNNNHNNNETNKDNLENLLLNLKIISNIKEFDKLSIENDDIRIDKPYFLQGVIRKWNGDSRINTIESINNIINEIFMISDNLLETELKIDNNLHCHIDFNDNNSILFQKIVIALSESVTGLQNLKITYIGDVSVLSKIDLIIIKIQNRINKIHTMLKIVPKKII